MSHRFSSLPLWAKVVLVILVVWFIVFWLWYFLGQAADESDAAITSCPHYVAWGDPKTGGTQMVDQCADGDYASSTADSAVSAVASSAAYGKCRQVAHRYNAKNHLGWVMFWVRLTKYWCWNTKNQITYRPTTKFEAGVTSFGSLMQWDDAGLVAKNTYNPPGRWESFSWGIEKFKRCLPTVWGCIRTGDKNLESDIHAYGNGAYTW